MRNSFLFTLLSILVIGCFNALVNTNKSTGSYSEELHNSLAIWNQKEKNLYRYTQDFHSWVGFQNQTTLTVENGIVIERLYHAYAQDSLTDLWIEHGTDVGTHTQGSLPYTIDTLYQICQNDILTKDTTEYNIQLSLSNEGLLQSCTYQPKNCLDDCAQGIQISNISFLTSQPSLPQFCTEIFTSIGVTVLNAKQEPITLDSSYTILNNDTVHLENLSYYPGHYDILNDMYVETLYAKKRVVQFVAYKNNIAYQYPFLISSDGCHIQKEIGVDTITLPIQLVMD